MGITVAGYVGGSTSGKTIVFPDFIMAGDLIIFAAANDSGLPAMPAGFTSVRSTSVNGARSLYFIMGYKVATGNESGEHTFASSPVSCGMFYVLRGVHPTTPIETNNIGTGTYTTSFNTGQVTSTSPGRRFSVGVAIPDAAGLPQISQSGGLSDTFLAYSTVTPTILMYYGVSASQESGTLTATTYTSDKSVTGIASQMFVVANPNTPPTSPTALAVTAAGMSGINATWTHNDPDGNAQGKYQMRWRRV